MARHIDQKRIFKVKGVRVIIIEDLLPKNKQRKASIRNAIHNKGVSSKNASKKSGLRQKNSSPRNRRGDPPGF